MGVGDIVGGWGVNVKVKGRVRIRGGIDMMLSSAGSSGELSF